MLAAIDNGSLETVLLILGIIAALIFIVGWTRR